MRLGTNLSINLTDGKLTNKTASQNKNFSPGRELEIKK